MCIYELVTREVPFKDIHDIWTLKKVVCDQKKRPKLPPTTNLDLVELAKTCWYHEPKKRPTFVEISERLPAVLKKVTGAN